MSHLVPLMSQKVVSFPIHKKMDGDANSISSGFSSPFKVSLRLCRRLFCCLSLAPSAWLPLMKLAKGKQPAARSGGERALALCRARLRAHRARQALRQSVSSQMRRRCPASFSPSLSRDADHADHFRQRKPSCRRTFTRGNQRPRPSAAHSPLLGRASARLQQDPRF